VLPLRVIDLGRNDYAATLELQRVLCAERASPDHGLDDLLLLVEHEPVITLGRTTQPSSLPVPAGEIARRGIGVHEVERGGDVTWHGPGQLVGYPIVDLRRMREDLHWYLRSLEDGLIDALESLGIPADRNPGYTGVWTAGRKIASMGVHVKRWVTLHGFALNVVNDLSGFDLIVPCGIQQVVMTSVAAELGGNEAPDQLFSRTREAVVKSLGRALDREPVRNQRDPAGVSRT
jgi:lipoyl(octanoyl) transferase